MGVDASASSLAPTPVKVEHQKPVSTEHHKLTLSERIKNIFNKPTQPDNSPHDTLVELANLDSPEDQTDIKSPENIPEPSQSKEETIIIDPQSETPSVDTTALEKEDQQETAEEIKQVTQTIQQESAPKVEVVETPKTLFPDSPPLYDQYHRAYEREKKTIKGALTRSHDISQIQKDYLKGIKKGGREYPYNLKEFKKNVVDFYDSLRSRGVPQSQIMERNSDKRLRINSEISPTPFYTTGIKRLDSLGLFSSDFLSSDAKSSETVTKIKKVAKLSDEAFKDAKDRLNQYTFLSGQDITPFIANTYYVEEVYQALSSIQKDFFSTPENQKRFTDYLNQHPDLGNNIFGFILNRGKDHYDPFIRISPFIETLIDADVNPEKKITISEECIRVYDGPNEISWLKYQNLYNRDQQIFLLDKSRTLSEKDFIDRYFYDKYSQQKVGSNFYKDYIIQSSGLSEEGYKSADLSSLIIFAYMHAPSEEDRTFYRNVYNVTALDYYYDILPQIVSNKDKGDLYFKDGKATSYLFKDVINTFSGGVYHRTDELYKFIINQVPVVLKSFSPEDQIFWTNILNLKKSGEHQFIPLYLIFSNESYLTKEGRLTHQFFKDCLERKEDVFMSFVKKNLTFELIQSFPLEEQEFWRNIANLNNLDRDIYIFLIENQSKMDIYFTPDHDPTSLLFKDYIKSISGLEEKEKFKSFVLNFTPEIIQSFSPEDQILLQTTLTLLSEFQYQPVMFSFVIQNIESISQKINLSPDPSETLKEYISVVEQISSSPSKEIQKIKNQLLLEILNSPNPSESYRKISDIFIKNNIPMIGKIYRVFEVLYPPEKVSQMLSKKSKLSRVLIDTKSPRLRQTIIFNDLLKANLGSGELSLVSYLNLFEINSPLLERARLGDSLTPIESAQLTGFFKKLDALYDTSLLSRLQPTETLDTPTLQSKITELYQKYKVAEGQTIADRVAQMYLSGLGIKSIPEALTYIKQTRESAHQRNLTRTDFSLSSGDLVKGVNSENLASILNFGCVAGEYLGPDAGSDRTPFDTDFIRFNSEYPLNKANLVKVAGYNLFVVVKNRGQFQNTTDIENPNYDPKKIEIFYSGVVTDQHYGVRTGLPSSEIDYLVAIDTPSEELENIYYEIAKHGVYIPVFDEDGNQIFTSQDYFRYRHSFDGVKQFNGDPIQIETSPINDPFRHQIDILKKALETESSDEIATVDTQIKKRVETILDSLGIKLKGQFDTSILGSRFYNTGSSGRHTNLPGDFDFDYTLVLDVPSYQKSEEVTSEIVRQFSHQSQIPAAPSQIRLTGVTGVAPKPIDLDIGINTTADTLIFASHEAIEQKLEFIRQTYGQDTYHEVVANILLAKQILKENHAYKKGDAQDGGFGGIGTENWILANNGNIKKAFESFWQAAHEDGREVSLDEFRKKYFILDSGQNLRETDRTHDNFIFALTDKGYHAMLTAIGKHI